MVFDHLPSTSVFGVHFIVADVRKPILSAAPRIQDFTASLYGTTIFSKLHQTPSPSRVK